MNRSTLSLDVLIAGAGPVGLALALLIQRRAGGALRVALADPAPTRAPSAQRAYAITPSGQTILEELGVWNAVAAEPVRSIRVTDSRVDDPVRPTFLNFNRDGEALAHIVGEPELTAALRAAISEAALTILPVGVETLKQGVAGLRIGLSDGREIETFLVAAADGATSPMRELAGLPVVTWDYRQTGLVAIVNHAREHGGCAVQHFLPNGPFAILPMTGRRSSIVWTDAKADAETVLSLHPDDLAEEIDRRFGAFLGPLTLATPVAAFPIRFMMARKLAGDRVALLGDAAHVIHPLAGQNLNLGLEDADRLAASILDAARLGLDAGDASALASYERARRAAIVAMGITTDLLNRLFSNDLAAARLLRDVGLGLVDRAPGLRRFFVGQASGQASGRTTSRAFEDRR